MKDPLKKRYLRDLRDDFGKYFVIFILMVFSIALTSGFLVADGSMIKAYDESFEKYSIEDGNFTVNHRLNKAVLSSIESHGVRVYENFYAVLHRDNGAEVRVYKDRKEIDRVCLMEGRLPSSSKEIAIDRMYADNNHLSIGDTLVFEEGNYTVTGLVALSDYSALFSSNDDIIFDAVNFSVGIIPDEDFESLKNKTFCYSFFYEENYADETEEKALSDAFVEDLRQEVNLRSYTPRYLNHAIRFTGTDMGGDKAMMEVLLYMIIVILGFIFAVTISSTIQQESSVIGTLLASGYSKKELIIHYMTMPLLVTLFSALIGNILGYTVMKDVCAGLYYSSYSLPTYVTIWSSEALIKTTLIPVAMMIVINFFILYRKLDTPIMDFLRRQSSSSSKRKALPLSKKIPFFSRWQIRVFLNNIPSYAVLLVGIIFANLLIFFGLGFPDILDIYEAEMKERPLAPYITMLKLPDSMEREDHKLENTIDLLSFMQSVETEKDSAEKFSAYVLKTLPDDSIEYKGESITIYGIEEGSAYIDIPVSDHQIYVSSALADKFELGPGDHILLKEEYEDKQYSFEVDGIYDYLGSLCVFMSREDLNTLFDFPKETFAGYFSSSPLNDISEEAVSTVIDLNALTKLSRQMQVSFGGMMDIVVWFAVIIYIVLIYILTKVIIDGSAQSISMNKIMGYTDHEIFRLYFTTTGIIFLVLLIGTIPFEVIGLQYIFRYMMIAKMSGWFPLIVRNSVKLKVILIAVISFLSVSFLLYRKITKVPMDQALKNVE